MLEFAPAFCSFFPLSLLGGVHELSVWGWGIEYTYIFKNNPVIRVVSFVFFIPMTTKNNPLLSAQYLKIHVYI